MKMTPLGFDESGDVRGGGGVPFGDGNGLGRDVVKPSQEMSKGRTRQLLKRQWLNVIIIQTQVVAMAFESGIGQLKIHMPVVFESCLRFIRSVIDQTPQEPERLIPS